VAMASAAMSASAFLHSQGHKRTFVETERMSALPPEADIRDAHSHVR